MVLDVEERSLVLIKLISAQKRIIKFVRLCFLFFLGIRRLQPHGQDHPSHLVQIRPQSNHSQVHRAEAALLPLRHHSE